jgi:hypothetical protein
MPHATAMTEIIPSVGACIAALEELLDRASEILPEGGLESALTQADLGRDLDRIFGSTKSETGTLQDVTHTAIETAFKSIMFRILVCVSLV